MAGNAGSRTAIELIFEEDEGERAHLEKLLDVSREEMVNCFIEMLSDSETPLRSCQVPATDEERLEAVRAFFRRPETTEDSPRI